MEYECQVCGRKFTFIDPIDPNRILYPSAQKCKSCRAKKYDSQKLNASLGSAKRRGHAYKRILRGRM